MNKKNNSLKVTLPEDHLTEFLKVVKSLVIPFGVDKVKEVNHYVHLLGESIDRHVSEEKYKPSPEHRQKLNRKRFIAIFKTRYLQLTDLEYESVITGIEAKMIDQTLAAVAAKGFDVDEYLKWAFEIFFVDNPKFCPPNLKQTCSQFFLEQFFYASRDKIKKRAQDAVRKKDIMDLVTRGRILIREAADKSGAEAVKDVLKGYRDGKIGVVDLRKKIEDMEKSTKEG